MEYCSMREIVRNTNRSSMSFYDGFAEVKSKAQAAAVIRYSIFAAVELIKNFNLFCITDSISRISDLDLRHLALL